MADKRLIEQVLTEQFQELHELERKTFCPRKEETLVELDSSMAQVVIGVRRSGKSTFCYNILRKHRKEFAYANFDDERFSDLKAADLNPLLEVLYKIYGNFKYLFLDEIQNVTGWHLFVNRLLRQGMHVLITGSNAKLLSGELATHLTGRYEQIELYPFSFAEYCTYKGIDTQSVTTKSEAFRRAAFDGYLHSGGFPELLHTQNRTRYITTLVDNILKRDIEQRHKIRYARTFEQLSNHLLNIAPAIIVENELAVLFGLKSHHTLSNYVDFLKQAYLLSGVQRYSTKSKLRIRDEKVYPIDVALMDARADAFAAQNLGWRLETLVYIELQRRNTPINRDIYYYKSADGYEADFVVCKGNAVEEIYQVCYDLNKEKTRKRELRGLLTASQETRCNNLFLITDYQREEVETEGKTIKILPAYEWLLQSDIIFSAG